MGGVPSQKPANMPVAQLRQRVRYSLLVALACALFPATLTQYLPVPSSTKPGPTPSPTNNSDAAFDQWFADRVVARHSFGASAGLGTDLKKVDPKMAKYERATAQSKSRAGSLSGELERAEGAVNVKGVQRLARELGLTGVDLHGSRDKVRSAMVKKIKQLMRLRVRSHAARGLPHRFALMRCVRLKRPPVMHIGVHISGSV